MSINTNKALGNIGKLPYVIGGMSFIPLVGILFGIFVIVWGLLTKKQGKKYLVSIGVGGICFTIIIYSSLIYFSSINRGGIYGNVKAIQTRAALNSLVQAVEYFRVQHGTYPDSLQALQASLPRDSFISVFDLANAKLGQHPIYFFYERVGVDHYYLRSVGPDGQPFTSDDIVPQVSFTPQSKVGLLLERKEMP